MTQYFRSASTLMLAAACCAGPVLHAAALPNRLSRAAAQTAPQAMAQGVSPRLKRSTALNHVSGDVRIEAMSLVLSPSAAQSAALDQLLAEQQNPASPRYHQWLTPAQFGAQFGISDADLQVLQNWLTNQGFQVNEVAPSRNRITFSGSASAVEAAFHTELNTYTLGGQKFFANSTAPQIPAALQSVVGAIRGLSSYRPSPNIRKILPASTSSANVRTSTQHADYTSSTGSHSISPWDFRQIYNANGLYNSGNTGAGIGIAVLGQSSIDPNQITYFQQLTGQTVKAPTLLLVPGSGASTAYQGDELESESDVEYASGVAPGATITFVYVGNTTNFNGSNYGASVTDALNYAITNKIAPILTYSYGGCETENTATEIQSQENYFRQANAQGQTILVSAGDTGAAGCEDPGFPSAYDGLQVSYPASSAYVTAIGGTSLNDTTGNYWSSSNNGQAGSAIGYIPESVWNENSTDPLSAGGGGASQIFSKPNWQVGTGVPNDHARDIPDISFSAAEHDAYLVCSSDSSYVSGTSSAACTSTAFGIGKVGGTSLPTPAFAGALAMALNANSKTAGIGNLNPLLYGLFGTTPAVFHDITTGNNMDPCAAGTLNCTNGTEGYSATTGYDLASGLGSMDLGAFSANLNAATAAISAKVATLSIQVVSSQTSSIAVNGYVSSSNSTTPTGTVSFSIDGGTPVVVPLSQVGPYGALASGSFMGSYAAGSHTITATYSGDANYTATSASLVTIVPTPNGAIALSATPTTLTINSANAHSGSWTLNLTSSNGYTGLVSYDVELAPNSPVPASGCVFYPEDVGIGANATVPTTLTFSYSASDCSGTNVIKTFGARTSASAAKASRTGAPSQPNLPLLAIGFTGLLGSTCLRRKRAWMTGLLALAAMAGTAGLSGCGSGSTPLSSSTTSGTGSGGTTGGSGTITAAPKGTYALTVTVKGYPNGTPTASTNLSLVIQ